MPVNYAYAQRFMGQPVVAHLHDGTRRYGIVQNVTNDGIWLRPVNRGGAYANGETNSENITNADNPETLDAENVFFAPFFLPFFALWALWPFLWW